MGSPVEEVSSYSTGSDHPVFARYEYPTSSVTILRFANGAVGKVASVMDAHQPYYFRLHLVGSHGVIMDGKLWSSRIEGLDPDSWTELGVRLESSADVVNHSYERQFRAFFEALASDQDMPETSLASRLARSKWSSRPTARPPWAGPCASTRSTQREEDVSWPIAAGSDRHAPGDRAKGIRKQGDDDEQSRSAHRAPSHRSRVRGCARVASTVSVAVAQADPSPAGSPAQAGPDCPG